MLGEHVETYASEIQRMVELGCELGNHSWDHPNLDELSVEATADQYARTDEALIAVCGQAATVARCPYGNGNSEKFAAVGKPFFMWSLDSLDWSYRDVDMDYQSVMEGDLTDGSIILMHDIHPETVEASLQIIPDLIAQGYKLVTVSELAEAKGVDLQYASYSDFWDSSLAAGLVAGYEGNTTDEDSSDEEISEDDSSEDDFSDDESSDEDYSDEDYSDEEY
jgi:peptidoglycan/xylan/chitin deacetylase (PgdA/CDA1 family)